ncbi:fibronectin type III domain-containing protein [Candidatus Poriferisodalis sp.]
MTPPTKPAFSGSPSASATSVTLSWARSQQRGSLITDYTVYIFTAGGSWVSETLFTALRPWENYRNYTVTGLQPGTAYTARVRARTIHACYSPASEATSFTTASQQQGQYQGGEAAVSQPGPDESCHAVDAQRDYPVVDPEKSKPSDVRVTPGDGTLTVSWTPTPREGVPDGEIKHALRWSQVSGVWANPADPNALSQGDGVAAPCGATSVTIRGLENGVATGVFVRSFTGGNYMQFSAQSSGWVRIKGPETTPQADPPAAPPPEGELQPQEREAPPEEESQPQEQVERPGAVTGLQLLAKGKRVTVTWQAPESGGAPDGYIVQLKAVGGSKGKTHRPKAGKLTTTFRNLEPGAAYKVWVRAQNDAGKGERAHARVTLPATPPR